MKGVTPLLLAVGRGDDATTRALVASGADLEAESKQNKMTPMLLAVERGGLDTATYLLEQGAKVDGANSERAARLRESFAIPNKPKNLKDTRADWDRDVPVWIKLAVDLGVKLD